MKPDFTVPRGPLCARMLPALVAALTLSLVPMEVRAGGVVTNCTEAALRAALTGGGTVTFACDGTIVLTNTIVITNNAILDASGLDVTISGSNAVRLFWVNSNVNLTLRNVRLADGYSAGAKGTQTHLDGWPGAGGAIYSDGGTVVAVDCSFLGNRAVGGAGKDEWAGPNPIGNGAAGLGGAIYSLSGSLTLSNTSFFGNIAQGGFGGFEYDGIGGNGGSALGGAIHLENSTLSQRNSRFMANFALSGGPSGARYRGHGGDSVGGAVYATNSGCFTEFSIFDGNAAQSLSGGLAAGGAAYQSGLNSAWAGTLFSSNRVRGGSAYVSSWGGFPSNPGNGLGGALYLAGSAAGITNCSVLFNQAENGGNTQGAISVAALGYGAGGGIHSGGTLSMVNCTVAGNMALGGPGAGGSAYGGGLNVLGSTILNSVTIANNHAHGIGGVSGPGGLAPALSQGGGIYGSVTLRNTLLASNVEGGNFYGIVTDDGRNISSDASVALNAAGSVTNTDPRPGVLGDFGGPTPTIPLLVGSPAIDAGNPAWCPPTDQRGIARPVGAGCDIGAFEGSIPNYPQLDMAFTPATAVTGSVVVLTYTLSNPDTNALSNVSFANTLPPQLRVASVPGLGNGCGSGSISAVAGGGLVTVTNVSLAANQSCAFAVNVSGPTVGLVTNTAGPVSSTETGPGEAIASAVLSLASSINGRPS